MSTPKIDSPAYHRRVRQDIGRQLWSLPIIDPAKMGYFTLEMVENGLKYNPQNRPPVYRAILMVVDLRKCRVGSWQAK